MQKQHIIFTFWTHSVAVDLITSSSSTRLRNPLPVVTIVKILMRLRPRLGQSTHAVHMLARLQKARTFGARLMHILLRWSPSLVMTWQEHSGESEYCWHCLHVHLLSLLCRCVNDLIHCDNGQFTPHAIADNGASSQPVAAQGASLFSAFTEN